MNRRICPIMSSGYLNRIQCERDECAMWSKKDRMCGLRKS